MRVLPLILLLIATIGIGSCLAPRASLKTAPAVGDSADRPLVGYLKHRDRLYRISDLMDPAFRAASDDPFVKGLDPDCMLAGP